MGKKIDAVLQAKFDAIEDAIEAIQNDIAILHHRTAATQKILDDHRRTEAIAFMESGKWDPCNAPQYSLDPLSAVPTLPERKKVRKT